MTEFIVIIETDGEDQAVVTVAPDEERAIDQALAWAEREGFNAVSGSVAGTLDTLQQLWGRGIQDLPRA